MDKLLKLPWIIVLFVLLSCDNAGDNHCFENILSRIEGALSDDYIQGFKESEEDQLLPYYEDLKGLITIYLQEDFGFKFYRKQNSLSLEEAAYVVFVIWHRDLNSKDYRLGELLSKFSEKNLLYSKCDKERLENSRESYKTINLGDTIDVYLPVKEKSGSINAYSYYLDCPSHRSFINTDKDILIKAKVVGRKKKDRFENYFFSLEILALSREDVKISMQELVLGDTFELDLISYGLPISLSADRK